MEDIKKKLDSSILEIGIINEYLKQFEDYKLIYEDIDNNCGEIHISCKDELIKLFLIDISNGKFFSIYRYHSNGVKYEQVDVVIYNDITHNCDRVIKYSGHVETNDFSYIVCSGFSYLNDKVVKSWKQTRIVPVEDLELIQYSNDMNLTELILMTDRKSSNIIVKNELKNVKKIELKIDKKYYY